MKRPQYVFRPNLNDPQHRRAWELLQQVPSARRKEFLVQAILATEQTDRLEESIRKVVRAELQAASITTSVSSQPPENAIPDSALDFLNTLTTKDRHGVLCEGRIRRLTPRECLRLQGWADDRIDTVLAIQSDNQAYKQAGNGVTVHVVEAIGRRIAAMDAELRGEALAP